MFKSILPKEYEFFTYFEKHIEITKQVSEQLILLANEKIKLPECSKIIHTLENQADEITHQCTEKLHLTFITPIERTDIFALIKRLDDLTDFIDSAVLRMHLYEIEDMRSETIEIAEVLSKSINLLESAIIALRNMKHNQEKIKKYCEEIRELENEGDRIFQKAITRLFKENDAINIIKWKEIFERFEKAVDRCESVANVIESVLIDNA
jgi:predicted phosphate transport protein (TIGR00153 family)